MTQTTRTYSLKLPQDPQLRIPIDHLREVATQAGQRLLARLWTETWLDKLGGSPNKAYKVIGEQQVQVTHQGQPLYLPSRNRRCGAEQVGRILRSQVKRRECYYDVLRLVQTTVCNLTLSLY